MNFIFKGELVVDLSVKMIISVVNYLSWRPAFTFIHVHASTHTKKAYLVLN